MMLDGFTTGDILRRSGVPYLVISPSSPEVMWLLQWGRDQDGAAPGWNILAMGAPDSEGWVKEGELNPTKAITHFALAASRVVDTRHQAMQAELLSLTEGTEVEDAVHDLVLRHDGPTHPLLHRLID